MAPKGEKKPAEKKPVAEKSPAAEKKPAPKAEKKLPNESGDKKGKNRHKKNVETYKIYYIFKVLKRVHPDIGICFVSSPNPLNT